jgi:hypothetical protein
MPTPKLTDQQRREAWQAFVDCDRSIKDAAEFLGIPRSTFEHRLRSAKEHGMHLSEGASAVVSRAGLKPKEAKGGWIHNYDDDGKKVGTTRWSVDEAELTEDRLERIAERMSRVLPIPAIQRPQEARSDLLNFIPLFDVHLGMKVGSYGTAEAVQRLQSGFRDVVDRAPMAETMIILNGGDFTEANDNSALTPQSKHPLAVDMDFDDLADVAVDVTIDLIEYGLRRASKVIYQPIAGNHDPAVAVAIRQGLRQRYRDNPRFEMKDGHKLFTHEWEGNLLAGIHGDQKTSKAEQLTLAIAARHAAAWGSAKRRELWRGHLHKEVTVNMPGMRVYQVNPICPPGRYANDNLFTGESDIQCVTYGKGGGRRATTVHIFDD